VKAGTLRPTVSGALGDANAPVIIQSGGTLNVNGIAWGMKPVSVAGRGVDGQGAVINLGSQQLDALRNVTLTGDATFGATTARWAIRGTDNNNLATLSTLGQPRKLTKVGNGIVSLIRSSIDPALGDIDLLGGQLTIERMQTGLGNPTNTVTIYSNAVFSIFSLEVPLDKKMLLKAGGAFVFDSQSGGVSSTNLGSMTLESGECFIENRTPDFTLSQNGPVLGAGGLTKLGAGLLRLNAANTYAGDTLVSNGTLALGANATLDNTLNLDIGSEATLDVSAAGFTLAAGRTLRGHGTVIGPLILNGTIAPAETIGTLTVNGFASLHGTLLARLNRSSTQKADKIKFVGGATLDGALIVANAGPALMTGDTFDLFDGTLSGSFAAVALPHGASHWITSDLTIHGTITFTNNPPAARDVNLSVPKGGSVTVEIVANFVTDADGDAVTITEVSEPANGTASIVDGTKITYTSTNTAASDNFTYTVSDGLGGTDTRTVTVILDSPEAFNRLALDYVSGQDAVVMSYLGVPGENYALEHATNLSPPVVWRPLMTNAATETGSWSHTNAILAPANFFRVRHLP
jgi:autotransporter-associated beta strand protein